MNEEIEEKEYWDKVIRSKSGIFNLRLKEVWRFRDLLAQFVRRDFVSFYKQTVFGPIWFFVQPIFTIIVYVFLFSNLAGISTDGIPAPLFYLSGIIAWSYFSECLLKTSTVFRDNANIFGKVYFPRLIMPLSIIVSNLIKFGVQFLLLLMMIIYYKMQGTDISLSLYVLLFPIMIILMAGLGLGLGMLVSAITTKYRDLALLLSFGIQLLMYATPIVYPLSSLKGGMHTMIAANPMTPIVEGIRMSLFSIGTLNLASFSYAVIMTISILMIGTIAFKNVEKNFVDTI